MSTDIKELYPSKNVTLVHSRNQIMNNFHHKLHETIEARAKVLGINLVLGHRVVIPAEGFPNDGSTFNVKLLDGSELSADLAVSVSTNTMCEVKELISSFIVDRFNRPDTKLAIHSADSTKMRRRKRFHPRQANIADQRRRSSSCIRTGRCCGHWRTQGCPTVSIRFYLFDLISIFLTCTFDD